MPSSVKALATAWTITKEIAMPSSAPTAAAARS